MVQAVHPFLLLISIPPVQLGMSKLFDRLMLSFWSMSTKGIHALSLLHIYRRNGTPTILTGRLWIG